MTSEEHSPADHAAEEPLKWPIGFIVMVTLAALYLILRFVQMTGWLIDWLF